MRDLEKRGRGRPKGTTIPEDEARLVKVADAVVKDPSLKATTAIKRVLHAEGLGEAGMAAAVRRLQGKWKERHENLLAAATRRKEARDAEHVVYSGGLGLGLVRYPGESAAEMAARIHRETIDYRAREALQQYDDIRRASSAFQAHEEYIRDQISRYQDAGGSAVVQQYLENYRHLGEPLLYSGVSDRLREVQATLDRLGFRGGRW